MSIVRHPEWFEVVRAHWRRTTGFLLASREPCLSIRDKELKAVRGRALASRDPAELQAWSPPSSWLLAVLLCPGDSTQPVVEWLRSRRADASRVMFFLHRDADRTLLREVSDAGLPIERMEVVDDWQELHRLFGLALNDRVYEDWKHLPPKP